MLSVSVETLGHLRIYFIRSVYMKICSLLFTSNTAQEVELVSFTERATNLIK